MLVLVLIAIAIPFTCLQCPYASAVCAHFLPLYRAKANHDRHPYVKESSKERHVGRCGGHVRGDERDVRRPGLYGFAVELDAPEDGVGAWLTPAPAAWPPLRVR